MMSRGDMRSRGYMSSRRVYEFKGCICGQGGYMRSRGYMS